MKSLLESYDWVIEDLTKRRDAVTTAIEVITTLRNSLSERAYSLPYDLPRRKRGNVAGSKRGPYRKERLQEAKTLLESGSPIRATSRETGLGRFALRNLYRTLEVIPRCPCGQPSTHQGWCSFRFNNSAARKELIRRFHEQASAGASERHFEGQLLVNVQGYTFTGQESGVSTYCAEKACPYPPLEGGLCRMHEDHYRMLYSPHDSSLDKHDLYQQEGKAVPALRIATSWEMDHYEDQIRVKSGKQGAK